MTNGMLSLARSVGLALVPALAAAMGSALLSPQKPPNTKTPQAETQSKPGQPVNKAAEAEEELSRVIQASGTDRAAVVRNLEDYLRRYPDAPRRVQVCRAIVESAMQLRDHARALVYAERIIAVHPEDSAMMLLAVDLLENAGDAASLTRAVGYISRVIDRLEKPSPEERPARVSQSDWEAEQKKLRMSFYLIRGRLGILRRNYDEAARDLETSYRLLPTAPAAMRLGEIAELRKEHEKAIEQYTLAFVLPETYSSPTDRADVRRKLGNVWRLAHGTEIGLGEHVLAAYDRQAEAARADTSPARNAGAKDLFAFVLRRQGGSELRLVELKGKTLVLNFWATWCLPCRELEPIFEDVERKFAGRTDVVFLAVNADEDESRVRPFLERTKIRTAIVFADGLNEFLDVRGIPTIVVLDREGKFAYRAQGFSPLGFAAELTAAIERTLTAP